jgi:hypothetical protein
VTVDTQTGVRKVVLSNLNPPSNEEAFALSADGRMIYYGAVRSESDIWIAERPKK